MAAKFTWDDPFDLESQLSDDERAVRDAAPTHMIDSQELEMLHITACASRNITISRIPPDPR